MSFLVFVRPLSLQKIIKQNNKEKKHNEDPGGSVLQRPEFDGFPVMMDVPVNYEAEATYDKDINLELRSVQIYSYFLKNLIFFLVLV